MNKKNLFGFAVAMAAVSVAGCKKDSKEVALVSDFEEIAEASAVDRDVMRDVSFSIGGKDIGATEIARVFKTDSPQIGMSVRVFALKDRPAVNALIAKRIASVYSGVTMQEVPQTRAETAAQLARAVEWIGKNFTDSVAVQMIAAEIPGYNITMDYRPVYASDNYVTYSTYIGYYLGGAHGEYDFYYTTLDPATARAYDFNSLVKPEYRDKVRRMLVDEAASTENMSVDDYLGAVNDFISFDGSPAVTAENFPIYHVGIIGQGLAFCYPKYSIAPGAAGCPVYVLPMDSVKDYLAI